MTVPSVIGQRLDEATRILESSGLKMKRLGPSCFPTRGDEDLSPETLFVIAQRPQPGSAGTLGSAVRVAVQHREVVGDLTTASSCGQFPEESTGAGARSILLIFLVLPFILAFAAASDMTKRGERGWIWGLIVLLLFPIGILFWLIARKDKPVIPGVERVARSWTTGGKDLDAPTDDLRRP